MTDLAPRKPVAVHGTAVFAPLSHTLSPEVAAWTRELRVIWRATGMSLSRFDSRYPINKGTVSRYLNGKRVPRDSWFLNTLLAVLAEQGKEVSQQVREHLIGLQLGALQVAHPQEYRVRQVSDELELAHVRLREADRHARSLEEQLAGLTRRVEELTDQHGRLREVWDADRAAMQAEKDRLEEEIADLTRLLQQARERSVQAERVCQHLENVLHRLQEASPSPADSPGADSAAGDPMAAIRDFPLTDAGAVAAMLKTLRALGADAQALVLAKRAVPAVPANELHGVKRMLAELQESGLHGHAEDLANRVPLADADAVARLLTGLRELGDVSLARHLAERAVHRVEITKLHEILRLLTEVRELDFLDLAEVAAARAVGAVEIADAFQAVRLLVELRELGGHDLLPGLAHRIVREVEATPSVPLARLLAELRVLGGHDLGRSLAVRVVPKIQLADAFQTVQLLAELRELGGHDLGRSLAVRVVPKIQLANAFQTVQLLAELRHLDVRRLTKALALRAAREVEDTNPFHVMRLLAELRKLGAAGLARELADRVVPAIDVTSEHDVKQLLAELQELGSRRQARALADRAAQLSTFTGSYEIVAPASTELESPPSPTGSETGRSLVLKATGELLPSPRDQSRRQA